MYIIPTAIRTKMLYQASSFRIMTLHRDIHIKREMGNHGDFCYVCEEFDVIGNITIDENEAQRSFVEHLFAIYDAPNTFSEDNFKKFRELIVEVKNVL